MKYSVVYPNDRKNTAMPADTILSRIPEKTSYISARRPPIALQAELIFGGF